MKVDLAFIGEVRLIPNTKWLYLPGMVASWLGGGFLNNITCSELLPET